VYKRQSIYGAPNNLVGTKFVSTISVNLTDENLDTSVVFAFNTGAPVVTVLENTIGNIWFTYSDVGSYAAKSNDLFTLNKTICSLANSFFGGAGDFNSNLIFYSSVAANNEITIISSQDGTLATDELSNTPIEIRVYN
jgi:hypothetical protein